MIMLPIITYPQLLIARLTSIQRLVQFLSFLFQTYS
jgi:hypothetical protein